MWRGEPLESWVGTVAPTKSKMENGFVYVLEADPLNCEILEFEAERRGLKDNCKIINVALWSDVSQLTLQRRIICDANIIKQANAVGKNSKMALKSSHKDEIEVKADSIDNIVLEYQISKIDHIHMTIGASEVEAIKGASDTLKREDMRLYVKSNTSYKSGVPLFEEVQKLIMSAGMTHHKLSTSSNGDGKEIYAYK